MKADGHAVESACEVLRMQGVPVAARTYRAWKRRAAPARAFTDASILDVFHQLHQRDGRGRPRPEVLYGRRKMTAWLGRKGFPGVSKHTVDRLMRLAGMNGLVRGRKTRTTIPAKDGKRAGDLLNRDFTAPFPNHSWVTDFTYVATWAGFVYVAFAIDLFSRAIVGWQVSTVKDTAFVEACLRMALWRRDHTGHPIMPGMIHHSDAGSQGGFNRSSQHPDLEVLDGSSSACSGSSFASEVEVAWASEVPARSRDRILGGDREGSPRGGGGRCHRRGASGRNTVVPSRWRNAHFRSEAAQRPVSLVS
jgi:transposase InsO family protein